jgi:hypothetical protein
MKKLLFLLIMLPALTFGQFANYYSHNIAKSFVGTAGVPYIDKLDTISFPVGTSRVSITDMSAWNFQLTISTSLIGGSVVGITNDSLSTCYRDLPNEYIYVRNITSNAFSTILVYISYTLSKNHDKVILKTRFWTSTTWTNTVRVYYYITVTGTYQ